ncbi:MAG: hypothetical protein ACREEC_09595, partial [Thermoplasmata archaeon]
MMGNREQCSKTLRRTQLSARARGISVRPSRWWIPPLATLALLLVVLTGLTPGGPGGLHGSTSAAKSSSGFSPDVLANTVIDLNRSQSPSSAYVPEYVALNNSTTLTKLPAFLTVLASTCEWVTVENLSEAALPASSFHNVQFYNVTGGNDSGTSITHANSFKVCGGTGLWINFVYWTYSIYRYSFTGLGVASTMTLGGFSDWSGTSIAPANVTAAIGPSDVASFKVASNLTFTAVLPAAVNGPNGCDTTGQICSYTQYSYVSAADASNVSKTRSIAFTAASGLRVTAAYENWTVGYSSTTVSDNTGLGGLFAGTDSFFQTVFVDFWYLW